VKSIFSPAYRSGEYVPVVHAYYDRADMVSSTQEFIHHVHTLSEIMYVNEGAITVEVDGERLSVGRKQFIWLDSLVRHMLSLDTAAPCSVMNIEFQLEERIPPSGSGWWCLGALYRADPCFAEMLDNPTPCLVLTDTDDTVYNLLKQIIQLADSTHHQAEALCASLTLQVLMLIALRRRVAAEKGSSPIRNAYVSAAIDYIRDHFCEHITVQQVAQPLHVQPAYLHRLFKEHMGVTMGEYIGGLRVEKAKLLLLGTDQTLLDAAIEVGISSQQRFSQLFKRKTGSSPAEYRALRGDLPPP
jgi:AraC-like DNA-binding protein